MPMLFSRGDLASILESNAARAEGWVRNLRPQNVTEDAPGVIAEAIERFGLKDIALDRAAVTSTSPSEHSDPHGAYWYITLTLPYEGGSKELFMMEPSTSDLGAKPDAAVLENELKVIVKAYPMTVEALNSEAHRELDTMERWVARINSDLAAWRGQFKQRVQDAVGDRVNSIIARRAAGAQLDFPIQD